MKNALIITIFAGVGIFLLVGCGQIKSPIDTVVIPDTATLQKQQDFDQAMIEKQKNLSRKGQ